MGKLRAHCLDVRYAVSEKDTVYRLLYSNGYYKDIKALELKTAIRRGELKVDNITLGKNNRLYVNKTANDFITWGQ